MASQRKSRKSRPCTNCGARLAGDYCHACGQRDADLTQPYWVFLEDAGEYLFSFESRFWKTIGTLLARPGRITREFLEGKRARFVAPIRFFILSILAFFVAVTVLDVALFKLAMVPAESVFDAREKENALAEIDQKIEKAADKDPKFVEILGRLREQIAARPVTELEAGLVLRGERFRYYPQFEMFVPIKEAAGDDVSEEMVGEFFEAAAPASEPGFLRDFAGRVKNGFIRAAHDPRRLNASLNVWLPRVMVVFVPMFAVFLWFFYWGRTRHLVSQLVFSLHFHTWLFLLLTFFMLAQALWGSRLSMTLFLGAVPLYLLLSLKEVSGQGWLVTALKAAVISAFYLFGFAVMLAAVFLMGLAEI